MGVRRGLDRSAGALFQPWSVFTLLCCHQVDGERGPARSYHSCTMYERTLVLFGGNYPNPVR